MDKVRLGMIGSQLAAHLHLNNLLKLRGLKVDVVETIYTAYASAEKGMRIELKRELT